MSLIDVVDLFLANSKATNTRKAYDRDFSKFQAWFSDAELKAEDLTPDDLAGYLAHRVMNEGAAPSTCRRELAGIRYHLSDFPSVAGITQTKVVRDVLAGIVRSIDEEHSEAPPLVEEVLHPLIDSIGTTKPIDLRDRALLLFGFASAQRAQTLVDLDLSNLEWTRDANVICHVLRSKTDQEGIGAMVPIWNRGDAYCPVRALTEWISVANIKPGDPIFQSLGHQCVGARLSREAVTEQIVKRRCAAVGLTGFSAHSLRAGYITTCAVRGALVADIMAVSGHKSLHVINGYVRRAQLFERNPLDG